MQEIWRSTGWYALLYIKILRVLVVGLGKIPGLPTGRGGQILGSRVPWRKDTKHVNMKKNVEHYEGIFNYLSSGVPSTVKKYAGNIKRYVEIMKKYNLLYWLWDLDKFRALPFSVGSRTWKICGLLSPKKHLKNNKKYVLRTTKFFFSFRL